MKIESEAREAAYFLVISSAVFFSFAITFSVLIVIPISYQYINGIQQRIIDEMKFCKLSLKEINIEMNDKQFKSLLYNERELKNTTGWRERRSAQSSGDYFTAKSGVEKCSGCCIPGLPGPPGPHGRNGMPGRPGAQGPPGFYGMIPAICEEVTSPPCIACPSGATGPPGPVGLPGNPGPSGHPGRPGNDGTPGQQGLPGEQGEPGEPGREGTRGEAGRPAISIPATPGDAGSIGEQGSPGLPGSSGEPGRSGSEGSPGPQGPQGTNGKAGPPGIPGETGLRGVQGSPGERGICPKYCALDGGVFFEDGTRR